MEYQLMKVVLLGTGGPRPDPNRMGPSTLVSIGDDNIIVDAGRGVATRLVQAVSPSLITGTSSSLTSTLTILAG